MQARQVVKQTKTGRCGNPSSPSPWPRYLESLARQTDERSVDTGDTDALVLVQVMPLHQGPPRGLLPRVTAQGLLLRGAHDGPLRLPPHCGFGEWKGMTCEERAKGNQTTSLQATFWKRACVCTRPLCIEHKSFGRSHAERSV